MEKGISKRIPRSTDSREGKRSIGCCPDTPVSTNDQSGARIEIEPRMLRKELKSSTSSLNLPDPVRVGGKVCKGPNVVGNNSRFRRAKSTAKSAKRIIKTSKTKCIILVCWVVGWRV